MSKEEYYLRLKLALKLLAYLRFYWSLFGYVSYFFVMWTISVFVGWQSDFLAKIIWFPFILVISIIISFLVIIKVIRNAKKIGKPIPLKWKIMLFFWPLASSNVLLTRYMYVEEWDYSKFKSNNANECFENNNFKYLADEFLTKECQLDSFKYLKKKFKNVSVVYSDKNTTTFRIGDMDKNAILGRDYVLIQENIHYKWIGFYSKRFFLWDDGLEWLHKTNGSKIFHLICWYSLDEKGCRKSIIRTIKTFKGNIYTKVFWRFDGMVSWILKEFKQFRITK